jgi:hypothetical protein
MQLLLIVIPCVVVGGAVGLGLDRAGVLPHLERPGQVSSRPVRSVGRPFAVATIVILATWILMWIIVLIVGLSIISASS